MPRQQDDGEDHDVEQEEDVYEEEDMADHREIKRRRSDFSVDVAEEEDEDDDGDDYVRRRRRRTGSEFFDLEAAVDSDEDEEEEEEAEDDFIVDSGTELPDVHGARREYRHRLLPQEDQEEDLEELTRSIQQRYSRSAHVEYDEEATHVEQLARLPSTSDPKLWLVKCAIGQERKVAVCLMQKAIDRGPELQVRSVVALDHLQSYIYIEADKEAHVREACKGMSNIYAATVELVPLKEMTDVLNVQSKAVDLAGDNWVRIKTGTYKGDLAMVVHVDDVGQKVFLKLIPRIDLQALANKLEGRGGPKKKAVIPPPRLMNIDEAREMNIRVERKRDTRTGDYFDYIGSMLFRDGFLYKTVAMKSISTRNIHPTFDELQKFHQLAEGGNGDMASLSMLSANRRRGPFMKGERVIVVKGDLRDMKGHVEKVEEDTVHVRLNQAGLAVKSLAFSYKELSKYFELGNHVKVISGSSEGATGMVGCVEGHVVHLVSDTTKDTLSVFADDIVESSLVTSALTRIGEYELHDLVILKNNSFGVIIHVYSEACQVLMGVPGRPAVALVRLREIKSKAEKRGYAQDHFKNKLAVKDVVKVIEGPCKGKQGPIEYLFQGVVFICDRRCLEHTGFLCAKAQCCALIGGLPADNRNGNPSSSSFACRRLPLIAPQSPMRFPRGGPVMSYGGGLRGGRGRDALLGAYVKVRLGPFKGCKGRVVYIKDNSVRVELEAQMIVVTVDRNHITDNVNVSAPFREPFKYGLGNETPSHPSRTPLHPFMTPVRDPGATPINEGMRTPMPGRAWNPMSPPRDIWEEGNPASSGSSSQYQPSSPRSRAYEAPTPGSAWTNTPNSSYGDAGTPRDNLSAYANALSPYFPSSPGGQPPMTPNSAYLPGTPGGQPSTPGSGGLDVMSPLGGWDTEGPWLLPDILVNVRKSNADTSVGVVREVQMDGSCSVALSNDSSMIAQPTEIERVVPKKADKIKIMGGPQRGATGKLIGVDGNDGIVKVDDTLDVKILDMAILAKLGHAW